MLAKYFYFRHEFVGVPNFYCVVVTNLSRIWKL